VGLDRHIGGPLVEASAWLMKHPPVPMTDLIAKESTMNWLLEKSQVVKAAATDGI
jgi:myo-inositol-1-phosphate synthase